MRNRDQVEDRGIHPLFTRAGEMYEALDGYKKITATRIEKKSKIAPGDSTYTERAAIVRAQIMGDLHRFIREANGLLKGGQD